MHDVTIRDESIRLGQFLKLADLAESGAEARDLVHDGRLLLAGLGLAALGLLVVLLKVLLAH